MSEPTLEQIANELARHVAGNPHRTLEAHNALEAWKKWILEHGTPVNTQDDES